MNRWKLSAVLGWSLVGFVLLAGAGQKGELRLKRLVIEDDRGRERIILQMTGTEPTIAITDEQGGDGVFATASTDASLLSLSGGKSGNAILLMAGPEIPPRVSLQRKGRQVNSLAAP